MACVLTGGFDIDCGRIVGGITSVFISEAAASDLTTLTGFTAATDNIITVATSGTDIEFFEFKLKRELSSLTVTQQHDAANGTTMVEQSLSAVFLHQDAADYANLAAIAYGARTVVVQTSNDILYVLGVANGLEVTTLTTETGAGYGDFVGSRLEMNGREKLTYYGTASATPGSSIITGVDGFAIAT